MRMHCSALYPPLGFDRQALTHTGLRGLSRCDPIPLLRPPPVPPCPLFLLALKRRGSHTSCDESHLGSLPTPQARHPRRDGVHYLQVDLDQLGPLHYVVDLPHERGTDYRIGQPTPRIPPPIETTPPSESHRMITTEPPVQKQLRPHNFTPISGIACRALVRALKESPTSTSQNAALRLAKDTVVPDCDEKNLRVHPISRKSPHHQRQEREMFRHPTSSPSNDCLLNRIERRAPRALIGSLTPTIQHRRHARGGRARQARHRTPASPNGLRPTASSNQKRSHGSTGVPRPPPTPASQGSTSP